MRVSSEYLKSCMLLSLTSMAGRTSCALLAYVIPCINELASAIYSTHTASISHTFGAPYVLEYSCYVSVCTVLSSLSL